MNPSSPIPSQRTVGRSRNSRLAAVELPFRETFFPLGYGVDVLTNRVEVLSAARDSFGHRASRHGNSGLKVCIEVSPCTVEKVPPLPIRRQSGHLYSMIADCENHAFLDLSSGTNFVWLSSAAVHDPLYLRHNFLEKVTYLLLGASVVTDIHAGCVNKQGKGVLLCGSSGAGKSTLSYSCARRGWTYTSDDTCYLRNDVQTPTVIGHSHRFRFRPEARALFPELNGHKISPKMEGKASIEVAVADLSPIETTTESSVSAIVYLKRAALEAKLLALPRGDAVARLSDECYSTGVIRDMHCRHLQKLADVPSYLLQYSNVDEALIELDRLVSRL